MCVPSCRCVFVSVVYPVAILSTVFYIICTLLMFVSDASGDHMVETYSSMGLVMALYAAMIVSFRPPPHVMIFYSYFTNHLLLQVYKFLFKILKSCLMRNTSGIVCCNLEIRK